MEVTFFVAHFLVSAESFLRRNGFGGGRALENSFYSGGKKHRQGEGNGAVFIAPEPGEMMMDCRIWWYHPWGTR
jgi:hypothetical protein